MSLTAPPSSFPAAANASVSPPHTSWKPRPPGEGNVLHSMWAATITTRNAALLTHWHRLRWRFPQTPTLSRPPDLLLPQHATTPTCCWLPQLASAAGEGLMPLSSSSMYCWYHFYFILPSLMMCVHWKSCLDGGTCLVCMSTSLAVSQILFDLFDCCFCIDWDCSVPLHNLITKGYGVILSLDVFGFGLNLRKGGALKQKPN
jgi:hypothetical protein